MDTAVEEVVLKKALTPRSPNDVGAGHTLRRLLDYYCEFNYFARDGSEIKLFNTKLINFVRNDQT